MINLTCYPMGPADTAPQPNQLLKAVQKRMADAAPLGWPTLKLTLDAAGKIRAADFPSAVMLFVFVHGGEELPDMPAFSQLEAGRVVWRNFVLSWDVDVQRLQIADTSNPDAGVS